IPATDLELPRRPETAAERPVEVEVDARAGRSQEVVGVGHVEHLEDHLEGALRAQIDRLRCADIPREVRVVLPDGIPLEDVAVGTDPLSLAGLSQRRDGDTGALIVRPALLRNRL